ncbi:hypothetical protein [Larkinella terrae]|uniref:DUF5723 domain-containing protein n=1 Tax=Larkinella terrae TaxID=2025311 RepID=A0A7K0EJG4_9BACT|nr:hypothetical protein [Larkinella terrae]MRS61882.1 hypothetical protein [Larkinella terrae]
MKLLLFFLFAFFFQQAICQDLYFSEKGKHIKELTIIVDSTKDTYATIFLTYEKVGANLKDKRVQLRSEKIVEARVSLLKMGTLDIDSLNKYIDFIDLEHSFQQSETIGVPIIIKKGFSYSLFKNKNIIIGLESDPEELIKEDGVILQVKLEKKQVKDFDSSDFQFTLLTGSNFSFFEKPKLTNFAGILNAYMPNIIGRLGISVGISNLNFTMDDPSFSNVIYPPKNVLIDPKSGFVSGAAYESITYKRYRSENLTSWSYYMQPTFELFSGENYNLSILGHLEFLSQTSNSKISEKNVQIDTLKIVLPRDEKIVLRSNRTPEPDRTITLPFSHGYFGLGVLWNVKQKDKFNFSLNAVGGRTTDNFNARQQLFFNELTNPRRDPILEIDRSSKWFYFVRALLTEKFTKVNATIGLDLRGNGKYPPQVGAYLGIKVDFSKFFGS